MTDSATISTPAEPESLAEASRWIAQLRVAYHRERAYVEELETRLRKQRDVVDFARYWHKARGMHRAPWLKRLRDALVEMEAKP